MADPSLVNSSGHCARYLLSVANVLLEQGDSVQILGNHRLSRGVADLRACEPAFTLRCEESPFIPNADPASQASIDQIRQRRSEIFFRDLDLIAKKYVTTASDVFLINSLRHWSIEVVVEWLEQLGPERAPTVILILHYTPYPETGVLGHTANGYKDAFRRVAQSPLRSRIALCTDSERLRAEYQSLLDLAISVLPIPHCNGPRSDRAMRDDTLSIAFLGEARSDKGFHLLPSAVRKVLENSSDRRLVFNIQAYRPDGEQQFAPQVDFPADPAVRILSEPLDEAEYEDFLAAADLILIPYLENPYKAQTSGVYCEAAALGIPVVVPTRTWMADQVTKNSGGVLFTPGDAASLADACLEALQNYAALRDAAVRAAPLWRSFHNARNFVACLETLLQSLPNDPQARGHQANGEKAG